jgi:hypothetical protein
MVFSDLSEKISRSLSAIICINYDRFRFQLEVPVPVSPYRFLAVAPQIGTVVKNVVKPLASNLDPRKGPGIEVALAS